jgi:hypothetical protein
MSNTEKQIRIRSVQCGICDEKFTDGLVPSIAKNLARHWNREHGDELRHSEQPFDRETIVGHNLHGNEYSCRVYEDYITAYDVINPGGGPPFKYQYYREIDAEDYCEDCGRHIEAVDGYRQLEEDFWRDKYLCDECDKQRTIERRKNQNESLGEFVTDGGTRNDCNAGAGTNSHGGSEL